MKKEFQVAMDLSSMIEEQRQIDIPFDEVGFISMFLAITVENETKEQEHKKKVDVVVLMHGESTASSMLKTAQELLGIELGTALNMPLTMEVQKVYEQLKQYTLTHRKSLNNGLLLLTDMGSLNSFGDLIFAETSIRTKAVTLTSTLTVLEAIRMANVGHTLEDIYQNIQMTFDSLIREQFPLTKHQVKTKKAIVVTCFTGEGVASKLYQRLLPIIDQSEVKIIQMQYLEHEMFKKNIDRLMEEYEIKAIAGTVEIEYRTIPFFSVYDIFDDQKLQSLKQIVREAIPFEQIVPSLTGIVIHLAFLIDSILQGQKPSVFSGWQEFKEQHCTEIDKVKVTVEKLEETYAISFSEVAVAQLTQLFIENKINDSVKK